MGAIAGFMTADHRDGDQSLVALEGAVDGGDWSAAAGHLATVTGSLERHFAAEEDELFPALERRQPAAAGPTSVMRSEHTQMRHLLAELGDSLGRADAQDALGLCETLLLVLQQHNLKEEHILYPMADAAFGPDASGLVERLQARGWSTA
jgi:iron-sulfur cluster repair protein YtfE (RIC family)